jgi:hypothetical protein
MVVIRLTSVLTISKVWIWYLKKPYGRVKSKITDPSVNTESEKTSIYKDGMACGLVACEILHKHCVNVPVGDNSAIFTKLRPFLNISNISTINLVAV